jgi:hypothetical protein
MSQVYTKVAHLANPAHYSMKTLLLLLTRQYAEAATYADAAERSLPPDAPPLSHGRLQSLNVAIAQSEHQSFKKSDFRNFLS